MSKNERIESLLTESAQKIEDSLSAILSVTDEDYDLLIRGMRYSTLGGGKRIRPFLTLEFCKLFGGDPIAALPFASAVEMIHCFSLIHDDLPCMDNDDLRRGRPTNHLVFGEDMALLAGDALSILAFETIAANALVSNEDRIKAALLLSRASGRQGMVAGQVMDMLGEKKAYNLQKLKKMHRHKTGALIQAAAGLGCCAAGADDRCHLDAARYAEGIGLAFQIIDDILDREGDAV
ncbi:MAG: polyprenyl synthetase family protein [Clostridiales bacterium]|nr:polyprenyl synthetase family protein [Clostridiales bacterium]